MSLPQDTQFYQTSGADSGYKPADRRKFSYGQTGSIHELTHPIVHIGGGIVLSGADNFAFASGAITPFTFDNQGRIRTDTQLVLSGGDVEIGAVEIKGGTNDYRVDTQINNDPVVGSPIFIPIGGTYYSGTQTYTNGDAVVAQFNEQGAMKVTGGGGVPIAEFLSPSDFTATYTSTTTITLSGVPFSITDSSQIVYVKVIPSSGNATFYVNGQDGVTLTVSSNVVTISGAGTPFASGDVYEVGINEQTKAFDSSTNSVMSSVLNPISSRYTDPEILVSAQDLTASYADYGAEISMQGYNRLGVWIVADVNDSVNVNLKVLAKHTSAGSDEYDIDGVAIKSLWTTGASDFKKYYEFDVGTSPYIQLQAIAGTVGATAGDLSIVIDKKWRD